MRKGTVSLLGRLYRRSREDRWSSLFGQVAVYSFVVTAITGVFLLFYYKPSMTRPSTTARTASWTASR